MLQSRQIAEEIPLATRPTVTLKDRTASLITGEARVEHPLFIYIRRSEMGEADL